MRSRLVQIARLLHQSGLLAGMDGNLSVRVPGGFLVTRSGCAKGLLTESDLVAVDSAGKTSASQTLRPTSELALHLACYRARPEIAAVIHAHPPTVVARTLAGRPLPIEVLPEALLILGPVQEVPYAMTGTSELAEATGKAIASADVAILERHGAVAVGRDLDQALIRMETLEHSARILTAAESMGPLTPLPEDERKRLAAYREVLG